MREFLEVLLERDDHLVSTAENVATGIAACERERPDLVFADLKLPDGTGMDLLCWTREHMPDVQVIMMTAYATTENAVDAMRMGAYDYQIKPFKVEELRAVAAKAIEKATLLRENRELKERLRNEGGLAKLIGHSQPMTAVIDLIRKVAPTRANILIEGESGTGKELVARAIHDVGPRAAGPFVAINCGAIPESLIEAELFGHAAGAFTGAYRSRPGLFEAAHGGSLLLDEVSELPITMQVKLLRALQERKVRRIGEDHERPIDARIIASTNKSLEAEVERGSFRKDLFYRLNVVRVVVPALRDHIEDVPILARAFVIKYAAEIGSKVERITDDALGAMRRYGYPGNVRELENIVERAVALAPADEVRLDDLPDQVRGAANALGDNILDFPDDGIDIEHRLHKIERRFIDAAMTQAGGVKTRAAELLGLSFRSLRYRLQKIGDVEENDD